MSKSLSRRNREKQARNKGFDLNAMKRRGTQIAIDMSTKKTKTKAELLVHNKHRKLDLSDYHGDDRAYFMYSKF
jgi:hypothetical protein